MSDLLCKPCRTPVQMAKKVRSIKSLKYTVRKTNMLEVIEDHYYQKVNRPNFFFEMGNDDPETATDRFDTEEYNILAERLKSEGIEIPPGYFDED